MFFKNITMACAAAALMTVPATRVAADGRDFAAGIVAGVVGSAIVRNANKQKRVVRQKTYRKAAPAVPSYVRQERRDIQTSLNYFGFPAGTADGVLGRKSRAAISSYQAHMGYPATGQLTDYEKNFLLQSYSRAMAGGILTSQQIAGNPAGPRGLLTQYRNEAAGITSAGVTAVAPATTVVVAPQPQMVQPQVLGGTTTTTTTVTAVAGAADAGADTSSGSALPSFMGQTTAVSLASHCNQVSLLTSTNGGFLTADTMVDANLALNEQFCLARTYAIAEGEKLASKIQGFSTAQIEQQCEGFGPALKEHVAAMSLKPHSAVMQDVSGFVLNSGMSPVQLAGTAKICLSVGYRTDNMDVALGSALLLSVLGEQAYGELMGHHLAQGFGVSKRADLSLAWYDMGLTAIENGATPVFAPGQPERNALLRKASVTLGGNSSAQALPQVQPASALPIFKVSRKQAGIS
ncbi:peptidoglycan-binding domain-containing protein [Litoreibacter arenae]|uniref:Peptidoglycan-binding domain-containing protein n=1 Tax=Litoreibacter arenae DSM 19593 TaxID=1123360 RepID=S9QKL6_9RHOB|nr:peptidoglycan-binding domain-containing protein [Litoreibacter arenae]EPX80098.1 Putative peptidoglycan-binding domain-containing protein [Litoreibacter arenae DSM 19593]